MENEEGYMWQYLNFVAQRESRLVCTFHGYSYNSINHLGFENSTQLIKNLDDSQ